MARLISDGEWLGLLAVTETDRAAELCPVMQVVLNRWRSPHYADDLLEVIRQPYQFSFFNDLMAVRDEQQLFERVRAAKNLPPGGPSDFERTAREAARAMLALPAGCAILPPATLNYWSPRSMVPRGGLPKWNWSELHCFAYPGIDPRRFVFARQVFAGDPLGSNQGAFDFR